MTRTRAIFVFIAAAGLALAQAQQQPIPPQSQSAPGGWRRVGDPPPSPPVAVPQAQDPSEPVDRSDQYGQAQDNPPAPPQAQPAPRVNDRPPSPRPAYGLPPDVTLQPGTFVTIRTNQPLSSDH